MSDWDYILYNLQFGRESESLNLVWLYDFFSKIFISKVFVWGVGGVGRDRESFYF